MGIFNRQMSPELENITFIYFDLDDTLIDHKNAQYRALVDVWTQYEPLQKIAPDLFVTVYSETNNRLWDAYRMQEIDKNTLRRRRFEYTLNKLQLGMLDWREVEDIYLGCYQRHWTWIDDAREGFIMLSKKYPVGVMTNGFMDTQKQKFDYFSLHRYSQHLIISEETGYLKPDPRIFEYSAKQAGREPEQLLYVGDSHASDILGGSQSGWKTAWYNRNENEPSSRIADLTFCKFSQLVQALT